MSDKEKWLIEEFWGRCSERSFMQDNKILIEMKDVTEIWQDLLKELRGEP